MIPVAYRLEITDQITVTDVLLCIADFNRGLTSFMELSNDLMRLTKDYRLHIPFIDGEMIILVEARGYESVWSLILHAIKKG